MDKTTLYLFLAKEVLSLGWIRHFCVHLYLCTRLLVGNNRGWVHMMRCKVEVYLQTHLRSACLRWQRTISSYWLYASMPLCLYACGEYANYFLSFQPCIHTEKKILGTLKLWLKIGTKMKMPPLECLWRQSKHKVLEPMMS